MSLDSNVDADILVSNKHFRDILIVLFFTILLNAHDICSSLAVFAIRSAVKSYAQHSKTSTPGDSLSFQMDSPSSMDGIRNPRQLHQDTPTIADLLEVRAQLAAQDKKLDSLLALISSSALISPKPVQVGSIIASSAHVKDLNPDVYGLQELQQQQLLHTGVAAMQGKSNNNQSDIRLSLGGMTAADVNPIITIPSDHFAFGLKYAAAQSKMLANHQLQLGQDLSPDQILTALFSENGLLIQSMSGILHSVKYPSTQKLGKVTFIDHLSSSIFNPDSNHILDGLGMGVHSRYLAPISITHFNYLIQEQLMKVNNTSLTFAAAIIPAEAIQSGQSLSSTLSGILLSYQGKCNALFDLLFKGHGTSEIQACPHHVSLWWLFFVFHINLWNRALTNKNPTILITEFMHSWSLNYASQLGSNSHGLPLVDLKSALLGLAYRCSTCTCFGSSAICCLSERCSTITTKSTSSSSAATANKASGFNQAYQVWKKSLPKETKDKSHAVFRLTNTYLNGNFSEKSSSLPSEVKSQTALTINSYGNRQHLIPILDCPPFHI